MSTSVRCGQRSRRSPMLTSFLAIFSPGTTKERCSANLPPKRRRWRQHVSPLPTDLACERLRTFSLKLRHPGEVDLRRSYRSMNLTTLMEKTIDASSTFRRHSYRDDGKQRTSDVWASRVHNRRSLARTPVYRKRHYTCNSHSLASFRSYLIRDHTRGSMRQAVVMVLASVLLAFRTQLALSTYVACSKAPKAGRTRGDQLEPIFFQQLWKLLAVVRPWLPLQTRQEIEVWATTASSDSQGGIVV